MTTIPKAGDVVVCIFGNNIGLQGVINGTIDQKISATDTLSVCFNASAYRDNGYVSCSGGPVPRILAGDLIRTDKTMVRNFWRFKDGRAAAHNDEHYTQEVAVWAWKDPSDFYGMHPEQTIDAILERPAVFAEKRATLNTQISNLGKPTGAGTFSLQRGSYRIHGQTNTVTPGEANNYAPEDHPGRGLIGVLQSFGLLNIYDLGESPINHRNGYRYTLNGGHGLGNEIHAAFRSHDELLAFLKAYGLEEAFANGKQDRNRTIFNPNADVDSWQPLQWVARD